MNHYLDFRRHPGRRPVPLRVAPPPRNGREVSSCLLDTLQVPFRHSAGMPRGTGKLMSDWNSHRGIGFPSDELQPAISIATPLSLSSLSLYRGRYTDSLTTFTFSPMMQDFADTGFPRLHVSLHASHLFPCSFLSSPRPFLFKLLYRYYCYSYYHYSHTTMSLYAYSGWSRLRARQR